MCPAGVEIVLLGEGIAAGGAVFRTDAFGWPPPKEIRVVTGGKKGAQLLHHPNDEARAGEQLHVYERVGYGHFCRPCRAGAFYSLMRSSPVPQPSLFESELRSV